MKIFCKVKLNVALEIIVFDQNHCVILMIFVLHLNAAISQLQLQRVHITEQVSKESKRKRRISNRFSSKNQFWIRIIVNQLIIRI